MVSVADVLRTPVELLVVSCPHPEAQVRWVATNELSEPAPFLEGGELLLCTGLPTAGWDTDRWRAYVRDLVGSRISALGFATGPALTHGSVPRGLVTACQEVGLNLLEVPMVTSFVSVSQAVAGLIQDRERHEAREAVALQRRLARAARRRDAARSIADELASHVRGRVWVLGPDGSILARAGTANAHNAVLPEVRDQVSALRSRGLAATAGWVSPPTHVTLQAVGLHEPPEAYFAVATSAAMSEYQRAAVQTATALLSLELERRFERREAARKVSRHVFDLLLEGEVRASELVLSAATPTGDDLRLPRRITVLRVRGEGEELRRAHAAIESGSDELWHLAAMSAEGGELRVITASPEAGELASGLARPGLHVGVGCAVRPDDARRAFSTAGFAVEQASAARPVVVWEDLSASGLTSLVSVEARETFSQELLGRLDGTATGRADLTRLATSFLRNHGRIHSVAREMDMHRNTVRSRVREIEQALGVDLDDPTARLNLWAALQISVMTRPTG
ncbi:PucR family transcriptional regulator [Streptomyces sp. NPDC001663]|uniref:PucR family transcriptional regulator n=1 Tax=Streptomyces sp. NPDC001663 TaxID=3364597 RepID=UPI0036C7B2CB